MWSKLASQWLCIALYIWTLIAEKACKWRANVFVPWLTSTMQAQDAIFHELGSLVMVEKQNAVKSDLLQSIRERERKRGESRVVLDECDWCSMSSFTSKCVTRSLALGSIRVVSLSYSVACLAG